MTEEFFQGVYNDLQRQLDGMNYRLSNLDESIAENIDLAKEAIELSYRAESLYFKANPSQKRRLLKTLLSNCNLKGTTLYSTYNKAFSILAEGIWTRVFYDLGSKPVVRVEKLGESFSTTL